LSKGRVALEERVISVERTLDGVKLKLQSPGSNEVIEVLLPFTDADRLGRALITESRTGMVQMELLIRKIADIEHKIHSLEAKVKELEKTLNQVVGKQAT